MKNTVILSGTAITDLIFDHEFCEENLYQTTIAVKRTSGAVDYLPVMVPQRLIDVNESIIYKNMRIEGAFHSYYCRRNGQTKLILFVSANNIKLLDAAGHKEDQNEIFLEGYVCSDPTHRRTPFGRIISDIIIANERKCTKIDYIPCVCWEKNADAASALPIGQFVRIHGRIQSREYIKQTNYASEIKTALEVSVSDLKAI